jgi:hypothetical protein
MSAEAPSINWIGARWESQCATAAEYLGWRVIDARGVSDYEGWGALLLDRPSGFEVVVAKDAREEKRLVEATVIEAMAPREYAVLSWSYGSCSSCDGYEDQVGYDATPAQLADVFGALIEIVGTNIEAARAKLDERMSW